MQEAFVIRYDYDSKEGFNLAVIGESFVGFDALLKDILEIAQLDDTVEFKTSRVQQGSIEVIISVITSGPVPFHSIPAFLEFLRIAAPHSLDEANTFFSLMHGVHRTVNDYFARNPVDQAMVNLIIGYIVGSIRTAGGLKSANKLPDDSRASKRQIGRLRRMVENGKYRRVLSPITEGTVSSIEVASLAIPEQKIVISEKNVENYLPDDSKILPEFENGDTVELTGELLSLQSTRGDTLKIRVDNIDERYCLLTGTPADGTNIEDYKGLFKQRVLVEAEISRKTMYKRPELIVTSLAAQQEELKLAESEGSKEGYSGI